MMGGLGERERWTEERCEKAAGTQGGKELRGRKMRKREKNVRGDGEEEREGLTEGSISVRNRQGLY